MVTMAESAANWRNTWIARIHSHTYIPTIITTLSDAQAQLLQNLGTNFYFEGTRGRVGVGGGQTGVPGENPRQPARYSVSHDY